MEVATQAATPYHMQAIRFDHLPQDMQEYLHDTLAELGVDVDSFLLPDAKIMVEKVLVANLPVIDGKELCRYRGVQHALAMEKEVLEIPIVLDGDNLIDGYHRTYKARLDRVEHLQAIRISQFFTP